MQEIRRQVRDVEPEQILQLAGRDDHGDAHGEAVDHRFRNELDEVARSQHARNEQDHAGHQRRKHQPVIAMMRNHAVDDDNEGAGRPADLDAAAAEQRNKQARNDGGDEACCGFGA